MDIKRLRELAGTTIEIVETTEQHGSDRLRSLAGLPPINKTQEIIMEASFDDVPTKAIEMIDSMLAKLPEEAQYSEQGDILRFILSKLQNTNEAIEGELLTKDRSSFANIARDLLQGAAKQLYKDGQKPTPEAIKKVAEAGANNFHSMILKAMDNELQGKMQ